jgi:hypothetical protein
MTASKAKPFPDGKQADILLSGITPSTIRRPATITSTSTNPMGVTNQELINRAVLRHQPGPALAGEHKDPRNDVLTSARRAEEHKHAKYAICAGTGSILSPFALETTGGHGASTLASVYHRYLLFTANARLGPAGRRARGQAQRTSLSRFAGLVRRK